MKIFGGSSVKVSRHYILLLHYCLYVSIVSVFSFILDVQSESPVVTVERWQSFFECSYFDNCCIHNRAQYISVGYALTMFYFPMFFKSDIY